MMREQMKLLDPPESASVDPAVQSVAEAISWLNC